MRRRLIAILLSLFAVLATAPAVSVRPANAAGQRLYLPITAQNRFVHREPLTQWTAFARTRFNDLAVDANGIVFASTDDGVLRWDSASGIQRWLTQADGVPTGPIGALALDATDNLWLAAKPTETLVDAGATTGVRRLAPDGRWEHFAAGEGGLGWHVHPLGFDGTRGELWIGDSGPKLTGRAANGSERIVDPPQALWIGQVRLMVVDRDGGRWFIFGSDQLWYLSPDDRWVDRTADLGFSHEGHIDTVELNALAADPRGGIWCGTVRGLVRLDVDGRWWRIAVPFADPVGAWQVVRALALDGAGRLWMGTDAGIARLE